MRLVSMAVSGFRGYESETSIEIDCNTTVIAGRNDAGKSTLLEALEIFFSAGKPDVTDFSVGIERPISIRCTFADLPKVVKIDAERTTELAGEYLLDSDGHLCIEKSWTRSKLTQPMRRAYAVHPRFKDGSDPVNAKLNDLKALAKTHQIDDDEISDRRVSARYRTAIWERALASGEAELEFGPVDLASDDGKAVGLALENYMPIFHLFRADRPGTEADQLAQDPAKAAIKSVLERHQDRLTDLSKQIESEVGELLDQVVERLHEVEPSLAEVLRPVDPQPVWSKAFSGLQFVDQAGVPLSKRGSGTRRLVLLSFFRATAEKDIAADSMDIVDESFHRGVITAVEEPETALHADLQSDILAAMQDIGELGHRQVLLTTHSANLLRLVPVTSIRYITKINGGKKVVMARDGGEPAELLARLNESLGVFTDHNVRCFVLVEGRNDIRGLKVLSSALSTVDNSGVKAFAALEEAGMIAFMPIGGGGNASLWASNLSPFRRQEVHIMDSDRESSNHSLKPEMVALLERADVKRKVFILDKREMENYLTRDAIMSAYAHISPFENEFDSLVADQEWNYIDIPVLVARAAHSANSAATKHWDELNERVQAQKESNAKKKLAEAFSHVSVAESLIETNCDLLAALQAVSEACSELPSERHQ